jgi:hypothetical protein
LEAEKKGNCNSKSLFDPDNLQYFNATGTKEEKTVETLIRSGTITEDRRLSGSQRG